MADLKVLRDLSIALVVIAAVLGLPGAAPAQTVTGTVQGTVTDASGGVLPGASIVLRNTETGQQREAVANEVGFYNAPFLPLGRYQVTASLSGFGTVVRARVDVTLNETRVVDFSLSPAGVTQSVTVTAEPPRINTTNAEVKGSLNEEQILDKPTANPGSFLSLAETFTGFQENPTSGQNNPTASSGSSINFNGTGTRGATFQINGVNNDDSSENQNRQGAALSTIKEFQVITNSYSAEFGRGYGAVVLVQTKSGTNQIRGDTYEYHQNSDLNARSFFASGAPKAVNRRNQYGFTTGFPIRHSLLFAFLSFDHTERGGALNLTRDLFLPDEIQAPRLTRDNDTPANRAFIESVLARFPSTLAPNDPRSNRTYRGPFNTDWPDRDYSGRLDWQPRSVDHVFARWQYTRQIRNNQDIIVGEQTRQNNKQQNIGITWTRVLSRSAVGEFRYGLGLRATHVDIAAGNDTPIIRFEGTPVATSIIGNAGQYPIARDQMDNQFVYNLSIMFGKNHSLKTGTDIRRQQLDDHADSFSRGFWTFRRVSCGQTYPTPYAAFLDGCVGTFTKSWGPFFLENRINEYNVYAEDNWRIRPNLTVNLGLRYEYVSAPREVERRIDYGFGDDEDNLEPRLGVAYSPSWKDGWLEWMTGGPGNASIRGGYGIYHGRMFQSVFSQGGATLRFNPPDAISRSFANVLELADPTGGFVFVPGPQTIRHNVVLANPKLEMPSTHQWNLTLERKVAFNSTVRLTYSGTRGIGLLRYTQGNLPVSPFAGGIVVVDHPNNAPGPGAPDLRGVRIDRVAADVLCAGTGFLPGININATCTEPVPIANNEISFRVPRVNERRPDPRHGTNTIVSNGADSWYHGLQTEWIKRLSRGLQFQVAYTWSKTIDTTSEATFVGAGDGNVGPFAKFARGLSRFHTPHRFTFNGSYLLPFWRGRSDLTGTLLGGWQLSGVVKLASGTPFTVTDSTGRDLNFDGFGENRPVILDPSILGNRVNHPNRSRQQLPYDRFRPALMEDFDKNVLGRNTFFTDGVRNVDLGIYKNFQIPGGDRLTVRIELFNAFNRVQFGFPNLNIAAVGADLNFGRIVGTSNQYNPRVIQVAVRYSY